MPDPWEYPWYASWDLAFHCVAIAHIDPAFAKNQLLLLCREWYMHPNGQIPAYEWSFDDVNPPVQAWAAMRVFEIDGYRDFDFLARMLQKLLINFTWWVNRKDAEGNNVFEGGFLGLDNIGPIDRSAPLPVAGTLEQADGTAWMAMYCLDLLEMAITLARHDATYEDIATKFLEHFAYIATAMYGRGMWDEQDGFYYDIIALETGEELPLRVRSMVGLLPLAATMTLGRATLDALPAFRDHLEWFCANKPKYAKAIDQVHVLDMHEGRLLSIVAQDQLRRLMTYLLDESEFLSPYGVRALSAHHRDHPFRLNLGGTTYEVGYEPAESRSFLFGGNSNWRGPVWFPVNYIVVAALRRFARLLRRRSAGRAPDRQRRRVVARRHRRRPGGAPVPPVPTRRRRSATVLRPRRAPAGPPAAARPLAVPRVLQRRRRRRPRRLPPDRLDRPRGRHHRPPRWPPRHPPPDSVGANEFICGVQDAKQEAACERRIRRTLRPRRNGERYADEAATFRLTNVRSTY